MRQKSSWWPKMSPSRPNEPHSLDFFWLKNYMWLRICVDHFWNYQGQTFSWILWITYIKFNWIYWTLNSFGEHSILGTEMEDYPNYNLNVNAISISWYLESSLIKLGSSSLNVFSIGFFCSHHVSTSQMSQRSQISWMFS